MKAFRARIFNIYPEFQDTDFVIGKDLFEDVQISSSQIDGFWYFKNVRKGLIKRFVLERTEQTEKVCIVTLIRKDEGKFSPRFTFQTWNTTKKAIKEFSKTNPDQNLIKAQVNLNTCHESFSKLIGFLRTLNDVIDFGATEYAVIDSAKKDIFENVSKEYALSQFIDKYGKNITEKDVDLLQDRRSKLEHFENLLNDPQFFERERNRLKEISKKEIRKEDVWQIFFENNPWIFGYGLQLVSCEGLDDSKLEQMVSGSDVFSGPGKRIDALLKTKGNISKVLFCEIKTHLPNLLIENYARPGVYVPGKELRGAVAQIQKTIHKVTLKIQDNYFRPIKQNGDPTGEEILFVKPRGIVIIGKLDDFKTLEGINYEKLSSFELYRQHISGIEILTFDELFERTKFIVAY